MAIPVPASASAVRRIAYVDPVRDFPGSSFDFAAWKSLCEQVHGLGFETLVVPPLWTGGERRDGAVDDPDLHRFPGFEKDTVEALIADLAQISDRYGLALMMDLVLDRAVATGAQANAHGDWYVSLTQSSLDPREVIAESGAVLLRHHGASQADNFIKTWGGRMARWVQAGLAGFRCRNPQALTARDWASLREQTQQARPSAVFFAWTPGLNPGQLQALRPAGFDAVFSSLPWWDYRSAWLVQEHARLSDVAPVLAPLTDVDASSADPSGGEGEAAIRRLWAAAIIGDGVFVPLASANTLGEEPIKRVNEWLALRQHARDPLRLLSGGLSMATVLFRSGAGVVINTSDTERAPVDWDAIRARLPEGFVHVQPVAQSSEAQLEPAGYLRFLARGTDLLKIEGAVLGEKRKTGLGMMRAPRIAIENVQPCVDGGRFPVKTTVGTPCRVTADIFADGHDILAASLLWRPADESEWRESPMTKGDNDRWSGSFTPVRVGRHCFTVRAWRDEWATYREQLQKKHAAGVDVTLEVEEGRELVKAALERARQQDGSAAPVLQEVLEKLGLPASERGGNRRRRQSSPIPDPAPLPPAEPHHVEWLTAPATAQAMRETDTRQFDSMASGVYALTVDRQRAEFASWYELFPRSQSSEPGVHGHFKDVIAQLPRIRRMGFDVLYFPPIHPIGRRNRKGRNNSLVAGEGDPGSPYAIGSEAGGHDALHPELGSLADFQELLAAAREHELEVALDFAIQCSPDHPWLSRHPEWFAWRADGSLRYAENPPKKYEDIVNPDFYSSASPAQPQAALWRQLRDVILFWVDQGVRIFRVDNPHTKPLPFWEWVIGEVQGAHPDVIFLSEAFTRPKMMYRLAKLGFTQSYTYFTWRNKKQELTDYLLELDSEPVRSFFRPNFFVNTPDINPFFLQTSGRPGFLIRTALATLTSGLWGMYSGFELCEAHALPGKEEYQDSEKYQLRSWDWDRPGNIVQEITRLNWIRRISPALQSNKNIRFHNVDNEQILFFSRWTPERDNIVLAAISLNPHASEAGTLELPLWEWGLPDHATVELEDLWDGHVFSTSGKHYWLRLDQHRPFVVWTLRSAVNATGPALRRPPVDHIRDAG